MGVLEWQKEGALSLFAWEAGGGYPEGSDSSSPLFGDFFTLSSGTKGGFLCLPKPCMVGKPYRTDALGPH